MEEIRENPCGRNDDLVAFVYQELDEQGVRDFQRHMHACVRCAAEVADFGHIRESIISWRDASLGTDWAAGTGNRLLEYGPATVAVRRPSALVAIREFFTLSPVWLKGATALASLLFCLCAVLAVAYLNQRISPVGQSLAGKVYSQEQLDAEIAKAVLVKTEELKGQQARDLATARGSGNDSVQNAAQQPPSTRSRQRQTNYAAVETRLRKPLTRLERQELAADLGLLGSSDDDDLDLANDRITREP